MRLLHYSDQPLESVYSVEQSGKKYGWHSGRKPVGLWVSVEGEYDWRAWCEAESFRDCDRQIATEVVLAHDHRVLLVSSLPAMLAFHRDYGVDGRNNWSQVIDWPRVAQRYQGIIIAPYRWEQRLDNPCQGWYYTWDCASGCIWDAAAVAELKPAALAKAA